MSIKRRFQQMPCNQRRATQCQTKAVNVTSLPAVQTNPEGLATTTGTRKPQRSLPPRLCATSGPLSRYCDLQVTTHGLWATTKTHSMRQLGWKSAIRLDFPARFWAPCAKERLCTDCCTFPAHCRIPKIRWSETCHPTMFCV